MLTARVQQMVADVAARLRPASSLPEAEAAALFNQNQDALIEAARAHAELLQWEAFTDAVDKIPDAGTKKVLTWVRDLFGLSLIETHLAWYLLNGRLSTGRAATVSRYVDRLCARLRPYAQELVDAFAYEPEHVRAPIASGAELARQTEAQEYYAQLAASGHAPVSEKSLGGKKHAKKSAR